MTRLYASPATIVARSSVWPDAFDHDKGLNVGPSAIAPGAAGQLPDPSAIGCAESHVSAVETQPDVGGFSVVVEGMACEPHDRCYRNRRTIGHLRVQTAPSPGSRGARSCSGVLMPVLRRRESRGAIVEFRRLHAETGACVPESPGSTWPRIPWAAMPSERPVPGHLPRPPGHRVR